jgi:hypothetical protein|nr:MAG TPA: MAS20 protein import receptor [Caudoviricetes sp.]
MKEEQSLSNRKNIDTEKILQALIESQNKKIELESKNLELQKKQLEHSSEYAMAALKAQQEDRADERSKDISVQRNLFIIIGVICFGVLAFGGFCLYFDKDDIFKELIKIIGYSLIPSAGAYYYGLNKGKNNANTLNSQENITE